MKKLEFYVSPSGKVFVDEEGKQGNLEYTPKEFEISDLMLDLIKRQYPDALKGLNQEYEKSKPNRRYYDFLRVHRFIRCNFGKFDGLTWDVEDDVLHIEDVQCPLKFGCDCKMKGIICNPKPFGLTSRETEVAKLSSEGRTYKEISECLGIKHSTIKNILQKVKNKLHLTSSKDIAKIFIATL